MTDEVFKLIDDYPNYMIGDKGTILNIKRGRPLKHCFNTAGYPYVELSKYNVAKPHLIHRLIAIAFIPNPNNYPVVNHLDEDVKNFDKENLEWCDQLHNKHYSTDGFILYKDGDSHFFNSRREFIEIHGGSRNTLRDLLKGVRHEYKGYTLD